MFAAALDWLLDRSVVPGYTKIGYRLRGLNDAPADPEGRLADRDVVVNGANSGIGAAACEQFARAGARVHMVVRDRERGEDARARISEQTGGDLLDLFVCDVSEPDSIRALAAELDDALDGIDVLVHNAGALFSERQRNSNGLEMTFAVHVQGPFLLTRALEPLLAARDDARVIFVTSGGMYTAGLELDDLELDRRDFDGASFYAHAKRAQLILAGELDRRTAPEISVHAMHPGWAATPGIERSLPRFHTVAKPLLRSPAAGADTIVWLAAAEEPRLRSGLLWMDRRPRPAHRVPWTREGEDDPSRLYEVLLGMEREAMPTG